MCVHCVFKYKIINNALLLGELSCILLNTIYILFVFDPFHWSLIPMTCLMEDKPFWLGTLYHHEKCRGCGLFVGTPLFLFESLSQLASLFGSGLYHSLINISLSFGISFGNLISSPFIYWLIGILFSFWYLYPIGILSIMCWFAFSFNWFL